MTSYFSNISASYSFLLHHTHDMLKAFTLLGDILVLRIELCWSSCSS